MKIKFLLQSVHKIPLSFSRMFISPMTNYYYLFAFLIVIYGFALRAYNSQYYAFGFDQAQIYEKAMLIVSGKPTLIGPRTGPAALFTGPLIYYLHALTFYLISSATSIIISTLFIYACTGLVLITLLKRYTSLKQSVLYLCLWGSSFLLVRLDRNPWNPNLSFLAGILVFFPLQKLWKQAATNRIDALLVGIGTFLGFQAHFSGLILLPLVLVVTILRRFSNYSLLIASLIGCAATLAPAFIFDIRHDWIHLKGLWDFITNGPSINQAPYFERLAQSMQLTLAIGSQFLTHQSSIVLPVIIIAVTIGLPMITRSINLFKDVFGLSLLWIACFILLYSEYRGSLPEYYFLVMLPAVFYLTSSFLTILFRFKKLVIVFVVVLLTHNGVLTYKTYSMPQNITLEDQLAAAEYISTYASQQSLGNIIYDIPFYVKSSVGIESLLHGIHLQSNSDTAIHLVYPVTSWEPRFIHFGAMALWIDSQAQ